MSEKLIFLSHFNVLETFGGAARAKARRISHGTGQCTNKPATKVRQKRFASFRDYFICERGEKAGGKRARRQRTEKEREIYGTMSMSNVRLNEEKCAQFQINSDNGEFPATGHVCSQA